MTVFIEIHWTAGSIDEARKVSRYLVQEHLVACAQIIPWVESVFLWNDQIETAQESKIILKTREELYNTVKEIIEANTTYDVPEITWRPIEGGNPNYLSWMEETLNRL